MKEEYKMLENVQVLLSSDKTKSKEIIFWNEEIYSRDCFEEACLNVACLTAKGMCKRVKRKSEKE
ncbi:hypothetical protein [Bacillus zhangzhouensis]|uniref:hypothetical protein n=1 Tax=Bacillus zhangzhouensis TaxID=1178540 RepID=UPI0028162B61|nr:hypothetical protein [Bacillus zhangzhouensis]